MKRGGCVILLADCPNGVGDQELDRFLRMDSDEFLKRVEAGERVHFMADILHSGLDKAAETFLISSLPTEEVKAFGFVPAKTVEEAIAKAMTIHGKDAKILCMPKGAYVAPVVNDGGQG
jgi:nickel-dependent lactate racemase